MRKHHIDRALNEITDIITNDSYNLTRDDQDEITRKINELKALIDQLYSNTPKSID